MVGLATAQSLQLPTAAATATGSAGATAGAAVCSLTLVGFGNRTGIKEATLSCTGGTIQVAAHRVLQDFWGTDKALPGVVWAGEENCVTNKECLLTICGRSNAVFPAATVTLLKSGSNLTSKAAWQLAVCVTTGSTITFRKSSFTMIKGATPLVIHSNSTSVLVEECTIHGNNFTPSLFSYSSAIRVDNAHLTILSSTVAMNNASSTNQGTVTGAAAAQINIQNSRFYSNRARYGGAIYAKDHAVITIKGSHFERNNASSGGAVYALNQAYVQVLPNGEGEGACFRPAQRADSAT
jgi:predicted outer membrane repeat protein